MPHPLIGTQVLPGTLLKHGIEATLDDMRDRARINTVLLFAQNYTAYQYDYHDQLRAGLTPKPKEPLQWVRTEERHYACTRLRHPAAHRYAGDILDEVAEPAARRGIAIYPRILENFTYHDALPGLAECRQIDAYGKPHDLLCLNHPDLREWWPASAEDIVRLHPSVAGFMFGQERGGPLTYVLLGEGPMCFCEHCRRHAHENGVDAEQARAGMIALDELFSAVRAGRPPLEGVFVAFWRIITRHPAALAWERLWYQARNRVLRDVFTRVKAVDPTKKVGWHIVHGGTWDPLFMAQTDLGELAGFADWIKPVMYSDCAAKRADGYHGHFMNRGLFADLDDTTAHAAFLQIRGLDPAQEPDRAAIAAGTHAASADYVSRFTRRAVAAVGGRARVYPGLGFDVAAYARCPEDHAEHIVRAAFGAGADGIFIPREYHEARPALLDRVGQTVDALFGPDA
jgi:hypothetical protein